MGISLCVNTGCLVGQAGTSVRLLVTFIYIYIEEKGFSDWFSNRDFLGW